jgi:ubiquinol-cytochrome c reductase cytochrome b subunit
VLALLLVGLPFFDRSLERRPWKRPFSVGLFTLVLVGLGVLGAVSAREDARSAGVAQQIKKQREDEKQFMQTRFEPELSAASLNAQNTALVDPLAAKGKEIFEGQTCNACHGDNGVGTGIAPKLVGVNAKYDVARLEALLRKPTKQMVAGGMEPLKLSDDEMKALISYLQSLK